VPGASSLLAMYGSMAAGVMDAFPNIGLLKENFATQTSMLFFQLKVEKKGGGGEEKKWRGPKEQERGEKRGSRKSKRRKEERREQGKRTGECEFYCNV
jgi:hypothetical protein